MISVALATELAGAGLRWRPASGDRFAIPRPALEGEVFTLSEMTIEAHEYPTGTILGFNGTTEWALDSVEKDRALWLPREDQLRTLLGATFRSLTRDEGGAWVVRTAREGHDEEEFTAEVAEDAYARALLALVRDAVTTA